MGCTTPLHVLLEHAIPSKPEKHSHSPVSVLQMPLLEHTALVCAVSAVLPNFPDHAGPLGHIPAS
jgi:hypothetical protein